MVNNWAIVGDRGTEFLGPENDILRIWKKLDDGILTMPGNYSNYRILVEIHDVRR